MPQVKRESLSPANTLSVPPVPRIAVAQTNSTDDIEANIGVASELIAEAAACGANAISLPECVCLMQISRQQLRQSAEHYGDGKIQQAMSASARKHRITVFAGTLPIRSDDPDRVFNSSLVYGPDGEELARYDKRYLFDVTLENGESYSESAYTREGEHIVSIDTVIGKVGLTVCYDLRFPELYRALVAQGVSIFMVPSAFSPTTGPAHWLPLLQARAIENLSYVIAAAQTGTHPSGRSTWGHSVVINPWGEVIAIDESKVGLLYADIDQRKTERIRKQLPSLTHVRQ